MIRYSTRLKYRAEAELWRRAAGRLLTAMADAEGYFCVGGWRKGICKVLELEVDTSSALRKMRKRMQPHRPEGIGRETFWFDTDTREGVYLRVEMCLKMARECDKLGGEE